MSDAEYTLLMVGSSSVKDRKCQAIYAAVIREKVFLAKPLPQNWCTQRAELWALTQALNWTKEKKVNIHTDLRYIFATIHVHEISYKECGFLMADKKQIENMDEISQLLAAIWKQKRSSLTIVKGTKRKRTLSLLAISKQMRLLIGSRRLHLGDK